MDTEQRIDSRNTLWRRITERLSCLNVSHLMRSFQAVITCGKSSDVVNDPIYTGPKITVPWTGEPFQYPQDRYLSNAELRSQLNVLEMRFRAQSSRLDESMNEERRKVKMARAIAASNDQFQRPEEMVNELQEIRKVKSASRCIE